jgi:hypothetical protein
MGLFRLRLELRAIRSAIEELRGAIEEHSRTICAQKEAEKDKEVPLKSKQVIVSYDDETVRDSKEENERQYRIQRSIKWAAWCAFGAAVIYAGIGVFQWRQMRRQTRISSDTLRQSTESFRIDERAWIELEPIKPATLFSPATKFIPRNSFMYELYPKNFGKTIARDVAMKGSVSGGSEGYGDSADQMERWQDKFLLNQFTEMGRGKPVVVPPSPIP